MGLPTHALVELAARARPVCRGLTWGVVLSLCGACQPHNATLYVDLRTDLVPLLEFDEVRLEASEQESGRQASPGSFRLPPDVSRNDFVGGRRIGELRGLIQGAWRVSAIARSGERTVAARTVIVPIERRDRAVTLTMGRGCAGVECDEEVETCLVDRCVPLGCTDGAGCEESCERDSDCPEASCGSVVCAEGLCLQGVGADACPAGQWCVPDRGCSPVPGGPDSGVDPDGGRDLPDGGPVDAGSIGLDVDTEDPDLIGWWSPREGLDVAATEVTEWHNQRAGGPSLVPSARGDRPVFRAAPDRIAFAGSHLLTASISYADFEERTQVVVLRLDPPDASFQEITSTDRIWYHNMQLDGMQQISTVNQEGYMRELLAPVDLGDGEFHVIVLSEAVDDAVFYIDGTIVARETIEWVLVSVSQVTVGALHDGGANLEAEVGDILLYRDALAGTPKLDALMAMLIAQWRDGGG